MLEIIDLQIYKLLIFNFQNHNVFYVLLFKLIKDNFINFLNFNLTNNVKKWFMQEILDKHFYKKKKTL